MEVECEVEEEFGSLGECLTALDAVFPQSTIEIGVEDIDRESDVTSRAFVPRYLFRGERARYATTPSSMERLRTNDAISQRARNVLEQVSSYLEQELRSFLNLSPMLSAGYMQHYGMPTELIDLTSDQTVAGFFASHGQPGTRGVVGVFATEVLAQQSITVDLTHHPAAERPRKQHAFTVFHRQYRDLKEAGCRRSLRSRWFGFTLTEVDQARYSRMPGLLDAHTDKVAGVLQLLVDDMVSKHGKLPDEVARWIANAIPAAPFLTRVIEWYSPGQPKEVELISIEESGFEYCEERERERNYQLWSALFPLVTRR